MNFVFTPFIYPLEEKVCISSKFNYFLDNPRTDKEIDAIVQLIKPLNDKLGPYVDYDGVSQFDLPELYILFLSYLKENDGLNIEVDVNSTYDNELRELAKFWILCRYNDKIDDSLDIEDEAFNEYHPSDEINNLINCLSIIETINYNIKIYLKNVFQDHVFKSYSEEMNHALNTWHDRLVYKDYSIRFMNKENLAHFLEVCKRLDDEKINNDKVLYVGNLLKIENETTDNKYKLVILVGIIELLLTRNPRFDRFNVEDSIKKQFVLKTSIIAYNNDNSLNLKKVAKELQAIYDQRSNVAHGNFKAHNEYSMSNNFSELVSITYNYAAIVLEAYINNPDYIDFLKEN